MHKIYELKDKLCDELEEYSDKKLDAGNLAVIDSLSHTIKNLDKIIEKYEDEDYSSAYDDGMMGGPYERDGNRYGSRYAMARGRGRNARRDSMGRYSSDNRMMVDELRELMNDAPDERTKMEFKRFIEKMEQM